MSKRKSRNLAKLAKKIKEVEVKKKSVDIDEFIKDYLEIPKPQWKDIQVGSYMRYRKTNGEFIKGGVVKDVDIQDDQIKFSMIPFNFDSTRGWRVLEENISKIWIKIPKGIVSLKKVNEMEEQIEKHEEMIQHLLKENNRLEDLITRLSKTIQKIIPKR